jgi:FMN-dependent oxidoreductase (nitrilotriacetate monooxygenase family)
MFDLIAYTNCSHSPTVEDAWRASDHEQSAGYRDLDFWTGLASTLERGGFDALFFADAYNVADRYRGSVEPTIRRGEQVPENDPIPLLSALAATTERLGLVVTASTSFYPPYLLAKKFSTIDDLSDGRLGWNVVTSSGSLEFENVVGEYVPHDERYDRAAEHVAACRRLWEDSWVENAVREDAGAGVYADPDRVSFVDYEGEYVEVPGPHLCAPTPQRTPVLFQAGQSDRGRTFGVRHAEALFSFHLSLDGFEAYAEDVADRAAEIDRSPSSYNLYPAITPYVAPTDDEARALHDRVLDLIEPETGLVRLSNHLNHDYGQYDLDAPLRDIDVAGIRGVLSTFLADDREWTVRDAAVRYARYPTAELVGTPAAVADELERWGAAGADGFVVMAPLVPRTFEDVATHLVPELRDRGLLADPPTDDGTLRERLSGTDELPPRPDP